MAEPDREWRTMPSRQLSSARLILFLMISAGILFGLMAAIDVPALLHDQQVPEKPAPAAASTSLYRPAEKRMTLIVVDQAAKMALRHELAEEQFHHFFNSVVGELPEGELNAVWQSIQDSLADELTALTATVINPLHQPDCLASVGGAALIVAPSTQQANVQVQRIKERMVEQLLNHIHKDRQRVAIEELRGIANDVSLQIAERFQKDLDEKIGRPTAERMNVTRQKDSALRLKDLETAAAALSEASQSAVEAAKTLEGLTDKLKDGYETLVAARAKKDSPAALKAAAALRELRAPLSASTFSLGTSARKLGAVSSKLEFSPVLSDATEKAVKLFDIAHDTSRESSLAMSDLKSDAVYTAAVSGAKRAREAAKAVEPVLAATQIAALREQAALSAELAAVLARQCERIATPKMPDDKKDPVAEAAKRNDQITRDLAALLQQGQQLEKQLLAVRRSEIDTMSETAVAAARLKDVIAECKAVQLAFTERKALNEVSTTLKKVDELLMHCDKDFTAIQIKLGLKEETNPAINARKQMELLARDRKFLRRSRSRSNTFTSNG